MSLKAKASPERIPPEQTLAEQFGSLGVCLVEGDAEQRSRERKIRRRSLILSILLQSAALALLLLVPLFGRTDRIVVKAFVPVPPYGHPPQAGTRNNTRNQNANPTPNQNPFVFHPPTQPWRPNPVGDGSPTAPDGIDVGGPTTPTGPGCPWCVDIGPQSNGPIPPQQDTRVREKPRLLKMTSIDPAMLIHRVEPVYPRLAIQTHREGRVELRAIIATDGKIRSLQVVSGDPLFIMSATEAVQQWRYKPTYLNGQPVEIDTYITVTYVLQH